MVYIDIDSALVNSLFTLVRSDHKFLDSAIQLSNDVLVSSFEKYYNYTKTTCIDSFPYSCKFVDSIIDLDFIVSVKQSYKSGDESVVA